MTRESIEFNITINCSEMHAKRHGRCASAPRLLAARNAMQTFVQRSSHPLQPHTLEYYYHFIIHYRLSDAFSICMYLPNKIDFLVIRRHYQIAYNCHFDLTLLSIFISVHNRRMTENNTYVSTYA